MCSREDTSNYFPERTALPPLRRWSIHPSCHEIVIVTRTKSRAVGGHFEATLDAKVRLDGPDWLALRIAGGGQNALAGKLFAHTSAV
jgi:hypothetical protein